MDDSQRKNLQSRLQSMKEKWPSSIVTRTKIKEFSGGALNPGTMANYDSKGTGPESFTLGRKRVYLVDSLIDWMADRASSE